MGILNPFGFGTDILGAGASQVFQKSTSIRTGFETLSQGGIQLGGEKSFQFETQEETINEGDIIINIKDSQFGGSFGQEIVKETRQSQEQTPTIAIEKPVSLAPALIGGGTTTGTGQAGVSSGIQLLPIIAIGALGFLGFTFLSKRKKK